MDQANIAPFKCCPGCNHPKDCKFCPSSKNPVLHRHAFATGPMIIEDPKLMVLHLKSLVEHMYSVAAHHTPGGTFTVTGEPSKCSKYQKTKTQIFDTMLLESAWSTFNWACRLIDANMPSDQSNFQYRIEKRDGVFTVVRK